MPLLLCHDCYTWVEPADERCPLCQQTLDAGTPDPPLERLRQVVGRVEFGLGEVVVPRRMLPGRGMLYATTTGLLFVPHRVEHVMRTDTAPPASSVMWTLAAMFWTPVLLIIPFVKLLRSSNPRVAILVPEFLPSGEGDRPAAALMENPGVFFVPRRDIRHLTRGWRGWRLERTSGPTVLVRPSEAEEFGRRLDDLLMQEEWRMVVSG